MKQWQATCRPQAGLNSGLDGTAPWLRILRAVGVALALVAGVARAETFDLVTFATPAGTRSTMAEGVGFSESTPTTFVTYAVYQSARSSGDPMRDFEEEWKLLVAKHYRLTTELKSEATDWPGGWKRTIGAAKVWGDRQRNFVSLLHVFTGHGVKVSVLVNYNDDLYKPRIDKFVASLSLQAPTQVARVAGPAALQAQGTPPQPTLTAHEWYRSVANYAQWGTNFTGPEIAKIGNQGYARWSYRFQPDGTYAFASEFWSMTKSDEYWSVEESGTYLSTATTIQITPRQAHRILRDRDGRQQGDSQRLQLEPATYRYAFQYLSAMERWYLILVPEGGRDTDRDGTTSPIPDFGKAYRYGPRPYCEQRPKPADCKG